MIEVLVMYKKDVLGAAQAVLSIMEKQRYTSSAFGAGSVSAHSSGEHALTVPSEVSTGLSYGLRRAVRSGFYVNYQATVRPNLTASRIIGLSRPHRQDLIMLRSSI